MSDLAHFVIWSIGTAALVVLAVMLWVYPPHEAMAGAWVFVGGMGLFGSVVPLAGRLISGEWLIGGYNQF